MNVFYNQFGIPIPMNSVHAVEEIVKIKQISGSNPWPVIEKCLEVWRDSRPQEWRSYLIELDNLRRTRKDPRFASTVDKVTGGTLRYTLDIPEFVIKMIRCVYSPMELPMDREFFLLWARKFPKMKVAQKV